jgi:hypothetical protein
MIPQIAPVPVPIVYHPRPPDGDDDEESSHIVEPFLHWLGATSILEVISSGSVFLPVRGVSLVICIAAAMVMSLAVASIEHWGRKPRFDVDQITYRSVSDNLRR